MSPASARVRADLREAVWCANIDLVAAGLVVLTWGNVSGIDRAAGLVAIKPSGVSYQTMKPDDIVLVSLATGAVVDGNLRPSSDTPTHLHLYRELQTIGGIVHTHSRHAVAWAQAHREIPCLGTTHADHFHGPVPVTRPLTPAEIEGDYEHATGAVILETLRARGHDPASMPAMLVAGHGPFAWGTSPRAAVDNAIALEATAQMAIDTLRLAPDTPPLDRALVDRHFQRKHGATAYYGQPRPG